MATRKTKTLSSMPAVTSVDDTLKLAVVDGNNNVNLASLERVKDYILSEVADGSLKNMWCGRAWTIGNASSRAATYIGNLKMLQNLNKVLGLGGYLVQNNHSRLKLSPTNHYQFVGGKEARLDGSMGHYQWSWAREFFVFYYESNGMRYEGVSLLPIPGVECYRVPIASISASGFAAMDRDTNTLVSYLNDSPRYRGGDNISSYDGTYRSMLGKPVTAMTTDAFKTAAAKNGAGWLAGSVRMYGVVKILMDIVLGTTNHQEPFNPTKDSNGLYQCGLGMGVSEFWSWGDYNGYRPILPMSAGIELGDSLGVATYAVRNDSGVLYNAPVPCFFGLKNPYAHLWRMSCDEWTRTNADKTQTHIIVKDIYEPWTYGTESSNTEVYSTSPVVGTGWITKLSMNGLELFPMAVGGSPSTYEGDHYWNDSNAVSGGRAFLRGADSSYGSYCGSSAVRVNDALSVSRVDYGVPLCESAEKWSLVPVYAEAE